MVQSPQILARKGSTLTEIPVEVRFNQAPGAPENFGSSEIPHSGRLCPGGGLAVRVACVSCTRAHSVELGHDARPILLGRRYPTTEDERNQ